MITSVYFSLETIFHVAIEILQHIFRLQFEFEKKKNWMYLKTHFIKPTKL